MTSRDSPLRESPARTPARTLAFAPRMSATVIAWQGSVVGVLLLLLRAFGYTDEATLYALSVAGAAALVWLASFPARRKLGVPLGFGGDQERNRILFGLGVIAMPVLLVTIVGEGVFIHIASHEAVVLAMTLIVLTGATLILLSSLVDWFYVRPYLLDSCFTPFFVPGAADPWRMVTRVRLVHRLLAVLGVLAGCTALIALIANAWIRQLDEVVAGAIAGVATVIAGYYLARAAPLVALATNPLVQICDVVELAEEYTVPDAEPARSYFVVDIAWEGVKLLEVRRPLSADRLLDHRSPHYDRMVDVADIARLLRRRRPKGSNR